MLFLLKEWSICCIIYLFLVLYGNDTTFGLKFNPLLPHMRQAPGGSSLKKKKSRSVK